MLVHMLLTSCRNVIMLDNYIVTTLSERWDITSDNYVATTLKKPYTITLSQRQIIMLSQRKHNVDTTLSKRNFVSWVV